MRETAFETLTQLGNFLRRHGARGSSCNINDLSHDECIESIPETDVTGLLRALTARRSGSTGRTRGGSLYQEPRRIAYGLHPS